MTTTSELKSYQFRREREDKWQALEEVLRVVDRRGMRSLTAEQVESLPNLYRAAVASLSVARAISLDRNVIEYLDNLCVRAYFVVYGTKRTFVAVVAEFLFRRFPGEVRRAKWALLLATILLLTGSYVAYEQTARNPDVYDMFVDPGLAQGRDPSATVEELREPLFDNGESEDGDLAAFSAMLFVNNSGVGILCFAVGVVPMALVTLILYTNGAMLGAMSFLYHDRGLATEWWSWILPHGITEFLAILLCAAAGLRLGLALLFPGDLPRLESLTTTGRQVSYIVLGSVGLFFIAAIIEGVFRQRVEDLTIRYSLATVTLVWWVMYFSLSGRGRA